MDEQINEIISRVFDIKIGDINDNLESKDIPRWDSLGQFALISAIETQLNITFEIAEIFEIIKIRDIKRIVGTKIKQ